jgi:hypothetical protein
MKTKKEIWTEYQRVLDTHNFIDSKITGNEMYEQVFDLPKIEPVKVELPKEQVIEKPVKIVSKLKKVK